jgi:PIN domain nuclease of toxin-antitoxin system
MTVSATMSFYSDPTLDRNPFDRLLIAQALVEPAHFFTVDAKLRKYSDLVRVI